MPFVFPGQVLQGKLPGAGCITRTQKNRKDNLPQDMQLLRFSVKGKTCSGYLTNLSDGYLKN